MVTPFDIDINWLQFELLISYDGTAHHNEEDMSILTKRLNSPTARDL